MSALEKFKSWAEKRHTYAKEWQARTGGKVMGYFCTYVPEEILYAANILPVRILGSHEPQDVTEPHIFAMFCPFCRDCLAQGLKGRFDYLDGIMIAHSCLHIRQAFTSWRLHIPVDYNYYLCMPNHVQSPSAKPYLTKELDTFKKSLENWIGKTISASDLDKGIDVMNRNRQLMRQLYELRRADDPPITGLETMYVALAQQMVDKEEHSQALEELLAELPKRNTQRETGARLMLVGSEDDDTEFLKMVESVGATVVVDDHCTGSRYFWNQVIRDGDPLKDIAARYIDRVPCPTKDWPQRRRFPHILQLAKDYKVQGAILIQQKFCDPHEGDMVPLTKYFKENGIGTLFLEFDVTVPIGPFRTRVEAFLETIAQEDLF